MTTILLIDDDPIIYSLTSRMLERSGYEVIWAKNGDEALQALSGDVLPDLVLCDIKMPGMDGHETVAAIRQDPRLRDLRIIMLTAHDQPADLAWAEEVGTNDYIVKPFPPNRLLEVVKQHLK